MRLRNIPGSREAIEESCFTVNEPEKNKGKWKEYFGNDHPICIEVGMGKGRFIMDMAAAHPDRNYIGIEMYSSVLIRAIQKAEAMEECPENFCFIRMDARQLEEVFDRGEVERIYLNFSDPWPKARHEDRRLTSRLFLSRYEKILAAPGKVEFKTDNQDLFSFSLEEIGAAGWTVLEVTRDLHHNEEMMRGNIMTEYEEKFSSAGNPICKLIAQPDQKIYKK
ncbi:MAG TPA: tRNA (guanosine(46)-N7)-methyltransferase TrmB [Lachnospiraceae bacterium]|nr:tRNA (guanosine(46)-N7)-methyltransferase TrmB [Lachnospiraceae bacterium]